MKTNAEVERWFANKKPPAEIAIRRVREIILRADPRLAEYMKYGSVHFGYEGDFVTFVQADKKNVNLMFHRGARIPSRFPHLEGTHPSARFMRFADLAEVDARAAELSGVARAWCELVSHAGDKAKPKASRPKRPR
ncbi:MAG: DUF1801 domain-containing protein [Candidatus Dormibacteraeota bacterium]|nr:DUF1801 domain-containing protein [Candidatus Dormibacteraeota bacterium]